MRFTQRIVHQLYANHLKTWFVKHRQQDAHAQIRYLVIVVIVYQHTIMILQTDVVNKFSLLFKTYLVCSL